MRVAAGGRTSCARDNKDNNDNDNDTVYGHTLRFELSIDDGQDETDTDEACVIILCESCQRIDRLSAEDLLDGEFK